MLPVLLLTLAVGYNPNDVSLDDLKHFAITDADLQARINVAFQFRAFARETKLLGKLSSAESSCGFMLSQLRDGRDATSDHQSRLECLWSLRKKLGEQDYYAGNLPPAYPAKYKREFERWLADKKAGRQRLPNGVLKDPT